MLNETKQLLEDKSSVSRTVGKQKKKKKKTLSTQSTYPKERKKLTPQTMPEILLIHSCVA